jgi:hypothetical protein
MIALLLLIVIGSTVWVGFDAAQRDFSADGFADSTLQWVVGCLLLWVIWFPAYLARRSRAPLKEKAK